jgi:hypothetical protein
MNNGTLRWIACLSGGLVMLTASSCTRGSRESPVSLPKHSLVKVGAKCSFGKDRAIATISNGTDWSITDIDIYIKVSPPNRPPHSTKVKLVCVGGEKREATVLAPSANGEFEANIGDLMDGVRAGEVEWYIDSVHGFK